MEHMGMIACPHSMCVLCLSTICIPKMKACYAKKYEYLGYTLKTKPLKIGRKLHLAVTFVF